MLSDRFDVVWEEAERRQQVGEGRVEGAEKIATLCNKWIHFILEHTYRINSDSLLSIERTNVAFFVRCRMAKWERDEDFWDAGKRAERNHIFIKLPSVFSFVLHSMQRSHGVGCLRYTGLSSMFRFHTALPYWDCCVKDSFGAGCRDWKKCTFTSFQQFSFLILRFSSPTPTTASVEQEQWTCWHTPGINSRLQIGKKRVND